MGDKAHFRIRSHGNDEYGPGVWRPTDMKSWREKDDVVIGETLIRNLPQGEIEPAPSPTVEVLTPRETAREMAVEMAEWITSATTLHSAQARLGYFKAMMVNSGFGHLVENRPDDAILGSLVDIGMNLTEQWTRKVYDTPGELGVNYDTSHRVVEPVEAVSHDYDGDDVENEEADGDPSGPSGPAEGDSGESSAEPAA